MHVTIFIIIKIAILRHFAMLVWYMLCSYVCLPLCLFVTDWEFCQNGYSAVHLPMDASFRYKRSWLNSCGFISVVTKYS